MAKTSSSSSSGGIGVCGLLQVVFLCSKVFGVAPVATWSWWLVFAPTWGPLLLVLAILGVVLLIAGVLALLK